MTMQVVETISGLPNVPAVYALFGGRDGHRSVAYVGVADKLKQRITQHLLRRDSSVVTGVAVVSLNPDLVSQVAWWEHPSFTDRICLEAAELVAFDVLEPTLRSRGASQANAGRRSADAAFAAQMRAVFSGEPTGTLAMPTLQGALERIAALELRLAALETRLGER
jgi:hypothetical protein